MSRDRDSYRANAQACRARARHHAGTRDAGIEAVQRCVDRVIAEEDVVVKEEDVGKTAVEGNFRIRTSKAAELTSDQKI